MLNPCNKKKRRNKGMNILDAVTKKKDILFLIG